MRYVLLLFLASSTAIAQTDTYKAAHLLTVFAADEQLGSTMTLEDLQSKSKAAQQEELPDAISVEAAAEPVPALKLRFYPERWMLKPGAALLHFSRAQLMFAQFPDDKRELWQSEEWLDGTGEGEVPTVQQLEEAVNSLEWMYKELHDLAMSEDFTWDHRLRDLRGPDVYMYLLPEVQESRRLARMLVMKIRYQLLKNDFEGAASSISDGLRLAEFVGQGETLIQKLVGIAFQSMMGNQITKMIATPGSPNLYWALATIPRPLVQTGDAVMWELRNIPNILPVLAEAESATWTEAQAASKWASVMDGLLQLAGGGIDTSEGRLALAIGSVTFVDAAKRRLEESGYSKERLEMLPALQLVLIDASRELRLMADNLGKAHLLPTPLGKVTMEREEQAFQDRSRKNRMTSMAAVISSLLFPAIIQAKEAETRRQMTFNRLMTLEALRMHAATHEGGLPKTLAELNPVPAMPDAYTGQDFEYQLEIIDGAKVITLTAEGPTTYQPMRVLRAAFGN